MHYAQGPSQRQCRPAENPKPPAPHSHEDSPRNGVQQPTHQSDSKVVTAALLFNELRALNDRVANTDARNQKRFDQLDRQTNAIETLVRDVGAFAERGYEQNTAMAAEVKKLGDRLDRLDDRVTERDSKLDDIMAMLRNIGSGELLHGMRAIASSIQQKHEDLVTTLTNVTSGNSAAITGHLDALLRDSLSDLKNNLDVAVANLPQLWGLDQAVGYVHDLHTVCRRIEAGYLHQGLESSASVRCVQTLPCDYRSISPEEEIEPSTPDVSDEWIDKLQVSSKSGQGGSVIGEGVPRRAPAERRSHHPTRQSDYLLKPRKPVDYREAGVRKTKREPPRPPRK